jgi:branched-chain amino acid transport system substrate-binding protein
LTTDSFIKATDSLQLPPDIFGSPSQTFSASKRLGSVDSRMSQIQDGRWRVVADYARRGGAEASKPKSK